MQNILLLANDLKQLRRDPFTLLLLSAPMLMIVVVKFLTICLIPILESYFSIVIDPYFGYIVSMLMLISSAMVGIVIGFMMIDDKDGRIEELLSITPIGRVGYLVNRLGLGAVLSALYSGIVLVVYPGSYSLVSGITAVILSPFNAIIIGLMLFVMADDKVKGLTIGKALTCILLFGLTALCQLPWLTVLSYLFPAYWFTALFTAPELVLNYLYGVLVHGVWFAVVLWNYFQKKQF